MRRLATTAFCCGQKKDEQCGHEEEDARSVPIQRHIHQRAVCGVTLVKQGCFWRAVLYGAPSGTGWDGKGPLSLRRSRNAPHRPSQRITCAQALADL
jgi:hypothetical protein